MSRAVPNAAVSECVDAGVDFWTAVEAVRRLGSRLKSCSSTDEIREEVFSALCELDREAAERYRRYYSMHVRTSRNTIEGFSREKIVNSLVAETSMPLEVAENIAKEAEMELRRLRLEFVSAPLIREVVNVKLLEHGFEEARARYTRLGAPVHDVKQLVQRSGSAGEVHRALAEKVLREYTLLSVLPLALADAHMAGEIHIHALQDFPLRAWRGLADLRHLASPESAAEGMLEILRRLRMAEERYSAGICLEGVSEFLAPALRGSAEKTAAMLLEHLSVQAHPIAMCISGRAEGEHGEEAVELGMAIARRLGEMREFGHEVYFRLDGGEDYLQAVHEAAASCKQVRLLRPEASLLEPEAGEGETGVLQCVSLNLLRGAREARGDEGRFFRWLEERFELAAEVFELKQERMVHRREQVRWCFGLGVAGVSEAAGLLASESGDELRLASRIAGVLAGLCRKSSRRGREMVLTMLGIEGALDRFREMEAAEEEVNIEVESVMHRFCSGGALAVIPLADAQPLPEALMKLSERMLESTELRAWCYRW